MEAESYSMYIHLMNSYVYDTQKNHPYTCTQLCAEAWVYISSHCWPDFCLDYFSPPVLVPFVAIFVTPMSA
jgi:hypothetical protein